MKKQIAIRRGIVGALVYENKFATVLRQYGNGFWFIPKSRQIVFGGTKRECVELAKNKLKERATK